MHAYIVERQGSYTCNLSFQFGLYLFLIKFRFLISDNRTVDVQLTGIQIERNTRLFMEHTLLGIVKLFGSTHLISFGVYDRRRGSHHLVNHSVFLQQTINLLYTIIPDYFHQHQIITDRKIFIRIHKVETSIDIHQFKTFMGFIKNQYLLYQDTAGNSSDIGSYLKAFLI